MNTKVLLGAVASTVIIFFGGWVIFGMLLMDMMAGEMSHAYDGLMKSPPDLPISGGMAVFMEPYACHCVRQNG
ncbi:MAG: hypothetical protein POELPBGB_01803 [Bacteroidia bacterium]|nr:hypothetical protein [Bacteroidia bacterium]